MTSNLYTNLSTNFGTSMATGPSGVVYLSNNSRIYGPTGSTGYCGVTGPSQGISADLHAQFLRFRGKYSSSSHLSRGDVLFTNHDISLLKILDKLDELERTNQNTIRFIMGKLLKTQVSNDIANVILGYV